MRRVGGAMPLDPRLELRSVEQRRGDDPARERPQFDERVDLAVERASEPAAARASGPRLRLDPAPPGGGMTMSVVGTTVRVTSPLAENWDTM